MKLVTHSQSGTSHAPLLARDAFGDAKSTLGSWDGCMSKAYCKWPVIVAIIVGALIIASIIFCCARCCCCGLECCCGCFRCCNACCPSPRGRKSHASPQPAPPAYGQWNNGPRGPQPWAQAPVYTQPQPHDLGMMSGGIKPQQPKDASTAPTGSGVARFSTEKPLSPMEKPKSYRNPTNGDQLPAMPTWAEGSTQHVLDESYHPPAESPPGVESDLARATGQEGVLLQDRNPQRLPTLPDMDNARSANRPTLPALDSSVSGGTSAAYVSSTALPGSVSDVTSPRNAYGYAAGAGAAGVAGAAYGQRSRSQGSRQQTPHNAYGAGARHPPGRQPDMYGHGYPPPVDRSRTVSPVSPVTPHSAATYPSQPAPSYRTRNNSSAPPLPAYASRQGSQARGPPRQMSPPSAMPGGFGPPRPSRTPPNNQWNSGYNTPAQPQSAYQSRHVPPQRAPSAPRAAPTPAQPFYQAYNPYTGQPNNTNGRAELSTSDPARSELHGAEGGTPRYELGGGEQDNWQGRPIGGWS